VLSGAVRIAPVSPAAQPAASGCSAGTELTPEKVSEETEEHPEPFSRCFLQPSPPQITAGGSWGKAPSHRHPHSETYFSKEEKKNLIFLLLFHHFHLSQRFHRS